MGGFITNRSAVRRHGVFAEERRTQPNIRAIGTGVVALVGQFPWGPDGTTVVKPTDFADLLYTFAPPGMVRTGAQGTGYLQAIAKAFAELHVVRVLGSTAAAASANLQSTSVTRLTVTLKYKGTEGNNVTWTVRDASDGDANKFDLEVATPSTNGGPYVETFRNINVSGVGSDFIPDVTQSRLVGSLVKGTAGRPTNGGPTAFTGGVTGTINAARYTGVAGTGDYGIAALEGDRTVRGVFVDDPGNTDRAAINSALRTHAILMGERLAIINGNSGLTSSGAIAAAALDRSSRVVYADPWVYIRDDVDGTERLVPPAAFFAAVMSQLSPSTPVSWKDSAVGDMLSGIVRLESNRGIAAGTHTDQGISTLIEEIDGGFRWESAVTTIAPQDDSKKRVTRTRMGDFIATSVTNNLRSMGDAPNVPYNQDLVVSAIKGFLEVLKKNKDIDPNNRPHILEYSIGSLSAANPQAELDAGDFTVPADIKLSSGMDRIFFSVRYGENVTVQVAA